MSPNPSLSALHQRRLRDIWRSAGWPCQDMVEVELLAAGLLERVRHGSGHETLRVTDAGVQVLAETLERNRARRGSHEALVERIAREMTRNGRLAWQGLNLRARLPDDSSGSWVSAMPDVFSVRHTSVEAYLEPIVHEVKVKRSDLLADLKRPAKRAAYLQLSSQCWYVLQQGIADPAEIPVECGVMLATGTTLEVARPAPRRALRMSFGLWMSLARATPLPGWRADDAQGHLGVFEAGPEPEGGPTLTHDLDVPDPMS